MATSGTGEGAAKAAGAATVMVDGRYEIQLSAPLPELSGPTAQAFRARSVLDPSRNFAALVIDPRLPMRHDLLGQLDRRASVGLVLPKHRGVTHWPPAGAERQILIVERPAGPSLAPPLPESFPPFSADRVLAEVVRPMRVILEQFAAQRLVHRAIRADNLFYGASGAGSLVLGECYSAPPGFAQPTIYEPIPRALARPAGRGLGGSVDDMFAAGVAILVLLLGGDPRGGRSDEAMLDLRIANGSYDALLGGVALGPQIVPLLKGLLEDDPKSRWTLVELARFLDLGWTGSPLHYKLRRATVPFYFKGQEYVEPRALARALARDWPAAVEIVQDQTFHDWLGRGAIESTRLVTVKASERASGAPRHGRGASADVELARALIMLDPDGPIRFKEFSAQADGLAPALADAMQSQSLTRDGAVVLEAHLLEFWVSQQADIRGAGVTEILPKLPRLGSYVQRGGLGFGVERCAYELNPDLACQSPLLGSGAAVDGPSLLRALESRAGNGGEQFDHHIAAFLAARIGDQADRLLGELSASTGDRAGAMLARLRLFAAASKRKTGDLPGLCRQLVSRMSTVINSFHNRPFRRRLEHALEQAAESGKLTTLVALVDDRRLAKADRAGYSAARVEYQAAARALDRLQHAIEARAPRAESLGHNAAAVLSGVGAAVAAAALVLAYAL